MLQWGFQMRYHHARQNWRRAISLVWQFSIHLSCIPSNGNDLFGQSYIDWLIDWLMIDEWWLMGNSWLVMSDMWLWLRVMSDEWWVMSDGDGPSDGWWVLRMRIHVMLHFKLGPGRSPNFQSITTSDLQQTNVQAQYRRVDPFDSIILLPTLMSCCCVLLQVSGGLMQ